MSVNLPVPWLLLVIRDRQGRVKTERGKLPMAPLEPGTDYASSLKKQLASLGLESVRCRLFGIYSGPEWGQLFGTTEGAVIFGFGATVDSVDGEGDIGRFSPLEARCLNDSKAATVTVF